MRKFLIILGIMGIVAFGCQSPRLYPSPIAPVSVTPVPTQMSALPASANPFGLMLGAPGLTIEQRIALVQQLGVPYFRPTSVFVQNWNGTCEECEVAQRAGLKLILTVRNNGGSRQASSPPEDLHSYAQTLGMILDQIHPTLLIVENEENSNLFFTGTPEEYSAELRAACDTAHARGIRCANGGLVSLLVALLVYNHYVEIGDTAKAQSFAAHAFSTDEQSQLDSPQLRQQIQKGQALLQAYAASGADYVNFHWYIADSTALVDAVTFLSSQTGLPAMTNEMGQHDLSSNTVRDLMRTVVKLKLPYAVWFSIDAPQAQALINRDGTLRDNGLAFQQFIREQFDIPR